MSQNQTPQKISDPKHAAGNPKAPKSATRTQGDAAKKSGNIKNVK